jgi:hypothetical protein
MKSEDVEKLFRELKLSFDAGTINEEEFQAVVGDLLFQDPEGRHWTIGAETEQWYLYDDGDWALASPPPTVEPVRPEVRPPGVEQKPLPPTTRRRGYGNRIILGLASFLFLLCLVAVALVSYQLGRQSVMSSPAEYAPTAAVALTQVPATEAPRPSEVGSRVPSPTEPSAVDSPSPTATQEEETSTTPTTRPTRVAQPTAPPMPTPEMRYGPPILVGPENGAQFGPSYLAILEWRPVGDLADNEYYDVQLCWNNCSDHWAQYQQDTTWEVPWWFRGKAIDQRFHWHVTLRLQRGDAPAGPLDPAISPQSETWVFLLTP